MDTTEAIHYHKELRSQLEQYLSKRRPGSFGLLAVGTDHVCKLGTWLQQEKQYGSELHELHHRFHDVSGRVVRLMMSTQFEAAERMLNTEYTEVETKLLSALDEMHRGAVGE